MSEQVANSSPRWTPQQRSAIEHVAGDLLVSAAAGSGKTAVLAERCARLVCAVDAQGGLAERCSVDNLLVLTFTEAAANEMRTRIAQAIHEKLSAPGKRSAEQTRWLKRQAAMVDRASISTLHAFCARVLRQHFHEVPDGLDPAFQVIDEDEGRLLREEVLSELLAGWHKPEEGARGDGKLPGSGEFAEFFEAYAQGREANCREMILAVNRMLESTADPAVYIAKAREVYSPRGSAKCLDDFARVTVARQLHLMHLTASRACATVESGIGPGPMLDGLKDAAKRIETALAEVEEKSAGAFSSVKTLLDYKWPTLKTVKDFPDFETLKEQTWEKLKKSLSAFCRDVLAISPEMMLRDLAALAKPLDTLLALTAEFAGAYGEAKRRQNRVDFADLERMTLNLIAAPGSLAAGELRRRYHHLLVDEFQDINPLQAALLEALRSTDHFSVAGKGAGNLFVVGDVKQSIYGFRLAEPQLFLDREDAFRKTDRYVSLPHNFRSHSSLLTAMNAVFEKVLTREIAGIDYDEGHALQAAPAAGLAATKTGVAGAELAGAPVELHLMVMKQEEDEERDVEQDSGETSESIDAAAPRENLSAIDEEARMVAGRIASLMAENRTIRLKDKSVRPLKYRDIAILLRSMKHKALLFARALAQRGIPVHADLATGYFDAPEVAATLDLLRVLDNPKQDIPLAGALLGPYAPVPLSHDELSTIRLAYDRKNFPFHEAAARYAQEAHNELGERVSDFLDLLTRWRAALRTRPLHEGLATVYADARIFPYLAGLDAGNQRVANLHALHQRALKFSGSNGGNNQGLHRFLRFIEQLRDQEADYGEAPVLSEASNVVRIMSVHKSKGLEFPVVIVSGLGSMLNLTEKGPIYVHRDLGIGLKVADTGRNIFYPSAASLNITESNKRTARAEELRLLYVALTRSRDHLILTGHVGKSETIDTARLLWKGHSGPLPEDVLLKARTALHWVLPALASAKLKVQWPDELITDPQLVVVDHAPMAAALPDAQVVADDPTVTLLQAAMPLPATDGAGGDFDQLFARITGRYAYDGLARQPAALSVTQLKKLADAVDEGESPEKLLIVAAAVDKAHANEARDRGVATHRVLELLDFATCSAATLSGDIEQLVQSKRLDGGQAEIADRDGIAWLLESPAGLRLRSAARDSAYEIRREIAFAWATPSPTNPSDDPADWPTIRGVIDLLLIHRATQSAEIFDYKTDSAFTWKANLEQYELQMGYYLRAASDILRFPVTRATLLFLTPHKDHIVIP